MSGAAPRAGSRPASSATVRSQPARTDRARATTGRPSRVCGGRGPGRRRSQRRPPRAASLFRLPTVDRRASGPARCCSSPRRARTDGIWKLADRAATEIWSGLRVRRIVGGACDLTRRSARRVHRGARRHASTLHVMTPRDAPTCARWASTSPCGAPPAWSPDGRSIAVAALDAVFRRLFAVPLDGGPPVPHRRRLCARAELVARRALPRLFGRGGRSAVSRCHGGDCPTGRRIELPRHPPEPRRPPPRRRPMAARHWSCCAARSGAATSSAHRSRDRRGTQAGPLRATTSRSATSTSRPMAGVIFDRLVDDSDLVLIDR